MILGMQCKALLEPQVSKTDLEIFLYAWVCTALAYYLLIDHLRITQGRVVAIDQFIPTFFLKRPLVIIFYNSRQLCEYVTYNSNAKKQKYTDRN